MLILMVFAFLAGIVTVLSPCILPVLPIVLSGSVGQGKRRPIGIVIGFILSFTFFTLFLSTLVRATGISADFLRTVSVIIIIGFGISLLIPKVQGILEQFFSFFARFGSTQRDDGFLPGVLVGLSLGLVWTPCVGPILASVISLAITGTVTGTAAFITLAYAVGTALPMLAITYGGRQLLQKVPWLLRNTGNIQRGFGVVMICIGIAILFNLDRQFQTWVLTTFPSYGTGLTRLEDNATVKQQLETVGKPSGANLEAGKPLSLEDHMQYPAAPNFAGGTKWLNSEPLSLSKELKGKVVLVDFWTYTCINCIRTLPFITKWYDTYKDKGFVVIGVHSPEFEFEKNTANVQMAIKDFGITYPVVQDNSFAIWNAYSNQYWPAHYLIDKDGKVRYTHFGEGKYEETENKIRELLGEEPLKDTQSLSLVGGRQYLTPETYLGYKRAQSYMGENDIRIDQGKTYEYTDFVPEDGVGLRGSWLVGGEAIESLEKESQLSLNFEAGKVYLVLAPTTENMKGAITVLLDGSPLDKKYWTKDMNSEGKIIVTSARKYDMVDLGSNPGRHLLTLIFDSNIQAFAFTFGQ